MKIRSDNEYLKALEELDELDSFPKDSPEYRIAKQLRKELVIWEDKSGPEFNPEPIPKPLGFFV